MKILNRWIWKFGKKFLEKSLRDKDPEVLKLVSVTSQQLANLMFIDMLDKERIVHCHKCSSRQQLRKSEGKYVCPSHLEVKNAA